MPLPKPDQEVQALPSDRLDQPLTEAEIKQLNADHEGTQTSVDTLYDDRLERRIDLAFFERQSRRLRDYQSAIRRNSDQVN